MRLYHPAFACHIAGSYDTHGDGQWYISVGEPIVLSNSSMHTYLVLKWLIQKKKKKKIFLVWNSDGTHLINFWKMKKGNMTLVALCYELNVVMDWMLSSTKFIWWYSKMASWRSNVTPAFSPIPCIFLTFSMPLLCHVRTKQEDSCL